MAAPKTETPKLLMPKATAVWLVENTSLTFAQISKFCDLHLLEVQSIADGDANIQGLSPIVTGQLTREEITRCENNPKADLGLKEMAVQLPARRGTRYTPIAKRRDKPNAVYWVLKSHPELTDAQICKLIGTTKSTIQAIRDKTYWNYPNMTALDPVFAGLCSQTDLNSSIVKANERLVSEGKQPVSLYAATSSSKMSSLDEIIQTRNPAPAPASVQRGENAAVTLEEQKELAERFFRPMEESPEEGEGN